jgi:hypothetical protein
MLAQRLQCKLSNLSNQQSKKSSQAERDVRSGTQIYYNKADSINAVLERSTALKAVFRKVLEVNAPMVVR